MKKFYSRTQLSAFLLIAGAITIPGQIAFANPEGGSVVAGQAAISQTSPSQTTITQSTDKAIINWNSFNIGKGEQTRFVQPSSSSITLNRVTGPDASAILGQLTANGRIALVNPNGILFGKDSRVDVAALIASTHDIKNDDFMAGRLNFTIPGRPDAQVINQGSISVQEGGLVALVAPSVQNSGLIAARLGKVVLASANSFTIDLYGDDLIYFTADSTTTSQLKDAFGNNLASAVENSGVIEANGGWVLLTAEVAKNVVDKAINMSGHIKATTVEEQQGSIILKSREGDVAVSGTLDASAPDGGNGGFIETSGANVTINPSAVITTDAPEGEDGLWLIDPNDFYIAAAGGNVTGTSLSMYLNSGNVTIQTATMGTAGGNGDIFVNDAVSWQNGNRLLLQAERNVEINRAITATSTDSMLSIQMPGILTINDSGSVSVGNVIYIVGDANLLGATDTYGRDSFTIRSFNNTTLHIEAGHTADTLSLSPTEMNRLNAINGGVINMYGSNIFIDAPFDIRSNLALHSHGGQGDIIVNAEISSATELPAGTTSTWLSLVAEENIQFNAPVTVHRLSLINDNGRIDQNEDGRIQADELVMTGNGGALGADATGGNSIGSVAGNVTNDFWINNDDRDITVSDIGGYNGVTAANIGLYTNGTLTLDAPLVATGTDALQIFDPWTDPLCTGSCKRPHISLMAGDRFIGSSAESVGSFWFRQIAKSMK